MPICGKCFSIFTGHKSSKTKHKKKWFEFSEKSNENRWHFSQDKILIVQELYVSIRFYMRQMLGNELIQKSKMEHVRAYFHWKLTVFAIRMFRRITFRMPSLRTIYFIYVRFNAIHFLFDDLYFSGSTDVLLALQAHNSIVFFLFNIFTRF